MRKWLTFAVALLLPVLSAEAQRAVTIDVTLPEAAFISRDAPRVTTHNILIGQDEERLIRNGFPARLRYTIELWETGGLVSLSMSKVMWDVIVDFEPLAQLFQIVRYSPEDGFQSLGSHTSFATVASILSLPYQPHTRAPVAAGSYFYSVTLVVERMTANDLEDVRGWLGTAVRRDGGAGSRFFRIVGSIFTRLVGPGKKRYEERSGVFEVK